MEEGVFVEGSGVQGSRLQGNGGEKGWQKEVGPISLRSRLGRQD